MTVFYKPSRITSPLRKKGEKEQYFPRVANRKKENLESIAKMISQQSALNKAEIQSVLETFGILIPKLLKENATIHFGDIGTFSLHINGVGSELPEEVNNDKITSAKIAFRPSIRIKEHLSDVEFEKVEQLQEELTEV